MRIINRNDVMSQLDLLVSWETQVRDILEQYGGKRMALLPCLEAIQQTLGYISPESVTYLRKALNIPAADIYSVASFYGMLTTTREGKYVVRLCDSLSCYINNSSTVLKCVEEELGIKHGETTPDKQFTLEVVPCLGLCDQAPAMMVNDKVYGFLTEESIKQIFDEIKKEENNLILG